MKHIIKSLVAACAFMLCAFNLTSCVDNHYEPQPTRKAYEMYCATQDMLKEVMPYFEQAFYANAVLAATDKTDQEILVNDYFGLNAEAFINDSNGRIIIYTGRMFERMEIVHNNVLLSDDTQAAEWNVSIKNSSYGLLTENFISGYDPFRFTITTTPKGDGSFCATFQIDSKEVFNNNTTLFEMKWQSEFFTPEFDNGMMELTASFCPNSFYWDAFLEVTTTQPVYAIYSPKDRLFNYQYGSWDFHAISRYGMEVNAGVSFFTDDGNYMLRTLYKEVSENFRQ